MEDILSKVFHARKIYDRGTENFSIAKERFFLVGKEDNPLWIAIMEGNSLQEQSYNHIASKLVMQTMMTLLLKFRNWDYKFKKVAHVFKVKADQSIIIQGIYPLVPV